MWMMLLPLMVFGQSKTETITKSFQLTDTSKELWFCVCNIEGDVSVEAYDGKNIEVEVIKKITARNDADLAEGMNDVRVDFSQGDGYAMARMLSTNNRYVQKDDPLACGWDWNRDQRRVEYKHRLDFKVKVPRSISVKISTVNNGDLYLKGVQGEVYANNVNGDVDLVDVAENIKAHTVNGHIEVSYTKLPKEFGEFETINGDIVIKAPANANGTYNFETQWGKIYSEFDFSAKAKPMVVASKSESGGTKYKIDNSNTYQLGVGGPSFEFKTMNGNIKILKIK